MTDRKITTGEASMLLYCIECGGDMDRWSAWRANRSNVLAELPEFDDWLRAKRTEAALRAVVVRKLEEIERSGAAP